jgi:hypothetical protein
MIGCQVTDHAHLNWRPPKLPFLIALSTFLSVGSAALLGVPTLTATALIILLRRALASLSGLAARLFRLLIASLFLTALSLT